MRTVRKLLLVNAMWIGGCVSEPQADKAPEAATAAVDQALTGDNGISINGVSLNGIAINGTSLNGIAINGISINGVTLNGIAINGVTLNGIAINGIAINGISLNGIAINGIAINGTDFVGAHLSASLSNGGSLELRIDDIAPLTGANSDVLAYTVEASTDSGWVPLCGYDTDGSVKQALAVPGTWNVQTGAWSDGGEFSFACRKASVAKCVEFGYKSWLGFADHHHACVRMLRADYCGDGTPHTITGTPINLYDNASVQLDTESWPVDAEWTPDGAVCLDHHRGGAQPSCYAEKYSASCGTFDNGALLIDEYNGQ
jgi:hypothetical protein